MNAINVDSKSDFNVDPNGVNASGEAGFSTAVQNSRGYGVSFGVQVNAEAAATLESENGVVTYSATADASLTVEGGVQVPHGGVSGSATWGVRGEYSVAMPENAATPEAIATANFFDPTTMPPGTTITVSGETYADSELGVTFRNIAVNSDVSTSEGAAFIVQRLEDGSVQVMTGPTSGLENASSLGVDFGVASAELGSALSIDQARYDVATFDINTPEGLAAYNNFLATGQMPAVNGDGVSNVHNISTVTTDWQSTAGANLGPLDFSTQLGASDGEYVTVRYPDGSIEATSTYQSSNGPTTTWHQSFGPDGRELIQDRRYDLVFDIPAGQDGETLAAELNYALGGIGYDAISAGQEVTLTFTEAEMSALVGMASTRSEQQMDYGEVPLNDLVLEYSDGAYVGNHADSRRATAWEFANNLVGGSNNMWEVAGLLSSISFQAGEGSSLELGDRVDIQATVTVDGEVVHAGLASRIESGDAHASEAAGGYAAPPPVAARPGIPVAV